MEELGGILMRPVVESWLLLLYFDWIMHFRGFPRIHALVRAQELRPTSELQESNRELSHAVDLASVFYFKPVLGRASLSCWSDRLSRSA
jgi:hypothetical protein